MDDQFFTIAVESTSEIKIKNSRFLGESCLVGSVAEAQARLDQVRKREYAASHHCYAYRVGLEREIQFKYSDDGEPSGTAGRPIFDLVEGANLTNLLVVVTRYFGGVKLGTGGLAHAYADAARLVLDKSGRREQFILAHFKLDLDFSSFDKWQKLLTGLGATVSGSHFTDTVSMDVSIRRSRADDLRRAFIELTSGKGTIEETSR